MGGFSKMIDKKIKHLSRFEVHKKLKKWHFDLDSTKQDYHIVQHIDRPAEFWQSGIDELIKVDPMKMDNGWFIDPGKERERIFAKNVDDEAKKGEYELYLLRNKSSTKRISPEDADHLLVKYQAVQSLHNDVRLAGAPKGDNWFDRRDLSKDNVLSELGDDIDLEDMHIRFATQNPMDMTYRHIDHEHSQVAPETRLTEDNPQSLEEVFSSRGKWVKYIILLHDLLPGQVLYWGNSVVKAKQGDMFGWDYGVPHWTVNFSNYPRHVALITGKTRS